MTSLWLGKIRAIKEGLEKEVAFEMSLYKQVMF